MCWGFLWRSLKRSCYCDAYGYNWIHMNESFRRSSASGNWRDIAEVCAGLGYVVPSALNHVWRRSTYAAVGVYPVWPYKCSLPAGLHCRVCSPWVLVSWAFFVLNWPSVQTACFVCVTPAGLSHCSPPLCARLVRHVRRLCQNPIKTRAWIYTQQKHFFFLPWVQVKDLKLPLWSEKGFFLSSQILFRIGLPLPTWSIHPPDRSVT